MIIALHVILAISSIVYATYLFVSPSKTKLRVHYGFVASTLISGTYLVVTTSTHMLQSCMSGLAYIGFATVATFAARRRLATVPQRFLKD